MKHIFFTFLIAHLALAAQGKTIGNPVGNHSPAVSAQYQNRAPLSFIENKGQVADLYGKARPDIQFKVAAAPGLNIFIGNGAVHYQFSKMDRVQSGKESNSKFQLPGTKPPIAPKSALSFGSGQGKVSMYRMDVDLVGANKDAQIIAEEKQDYYENYFTSATMGNSVSAYTYGKITYKDIYPNIDWVLRINNGHLEYEFVVRAGGNVANIQLKYGGATNISINDDGSLTAATPMGSISEQAPISYQQDGSKIVSSFKLTDNMLTYETGSYSGTLVIDPTLAWGTYYGGGGADYTQGITTDRAGNVFISGYTTSISGIATSGAYDTTAASAPSFTDGFFAKFNSAGAILWATYYGGTNYDDVAGVVTDTAGNLYITGATSSTSGIATPGAYHTTLGGASDAFLAKFNGAGLIQWATYIGGANQDGAAGIAIDDSGYLYIAGQTESTTGLSTTGTYQPTFGGGIQDAFVAKFSNAGAIQWSTYYGGTGIDEAWAIAIDDSNNVLVTGSSTSPEGIATVYGYDTAYIAVGTGRPDAFLAKFSSAGHIRWATYYGGTGENAGYGVAADSVGNIFITGWTTSLSFIATSGAYHTSASFGFNYCFLARFTRAGALSWGTYFGAGGYDAGYGLVTDTAGSVYFTGITGADTGVATAGAYQPVYGGGTQDAFLVKFDSSGALKWGTYYGGSGADNGIGVAKDRTSHVYIAGYTNSLSGIATPGAYQTTEADGGAAEDAFLAKFNDCNLPPAGSITGASIVCTGSHITLSESLSGGVWTSNNATASVTSGTITGITTGTDTIRYSVANSCSEVSATHIIHVDSLPDAGTISGQNSVCIDSMAVLADAVTGGIWSSSNIGVATVAAGAVSPVMAGTDTIKYAVTNTCGTTVAEKVIAITTDCIAGVKNIPSSIRDLVIYPMPVQDKLFITCDEPIGSISIFNLLGQGVFNGAYNATQAQVDVATLPKGVYFLRINGDVVRKFVKE